MPLREGRGANEREDRRDDGDCAGLGMRRAGCEGRGPGAGRTARLASAAFPCLVAVARRSAWATTMVRLEARARGPEARRRDAVRGATPTVLAVIMPTRAALSEIGRRDGSRGRGRRDGARTTLRVDPTDVFRERHNGARAMVVSRARVVRARARSSMNDVAAGPNLRSSPRARAGRGFPPRTKSRCGHSSVEC